MPQSVLIIGEDPALVDFSAAGTPPGLTAESVMAGLNASRDRLRAQGHAAEILLTTEAERIEGEVADALRGHAYDVIVVGAGLRTLPPMADKFERLMNALREQAPRARLAFNSKPDDSDVAALRQLAD